jgi:hypothetical protein
MSRRSPAILVSLWTMQKNFPRRGWVSEEDIIILPRAISELPRIEGRSHLPKDTSVRSHLYFYCVFLFLLFCKNMIRRKCFAQAKHIRRAKLDAYCQLRTSGSSRYPSIRPGHLWRVCYILHRAKQQVRTIKAGRGRTKKVSSTSVDRPDLRVWILEQVQFSTL